RLAMGARPMLFAQAALEAARLAALLEGADFIAWMRHLAGLPPPIMLAAVALSNYFAFTIFRFASSLRCHFFPEVRARLEFRLQRAGEQFIDHSFWRRCFIE